MVMTLNACATQTVLIDNENDSTERAAALEGRDFEMASNAMIQDMLDMGTLSKPNGQPYILVISRIENDTMQRIDVDLQVPVLFDAFRAHHLAQVGIPLFHLLALVVGQVEFRQVVRPQAVDVASVGAEQVFHLPHVQQEFCTVRIFQTVGDEHKRKLVGVGVQAVMPRPVLAG